MFIGQCVGESPFERAEDLAPSLSFQEQCPKPGQRNGLKSSGCHVFSLPLAPLPCQAPGAVVYTAARGLPAVLQPLPEVMLLGPGVPPCSQPRAPHGDPRLPSGPVKANHIHTSGSCPSSSCSRVDPSFAKVTLTGGAQATPAAKEPGERTALSSESRSSPSTVRLLERRSPVRNMTDLFDAEMGVLICIMRPSHRPHSVVVRIMSFVKLLSKLHREMEA